MTRLLSLLFNLVYLGVLALLSPWLAYKAATTGKYRRGLVDKFFGAAKHPLLDTAPSGFTVWLHGVSVGEIHLLRHLVAAIKKRHPDWRLVVSSTTDTGYEEARKSFPDLPVIWWPLDFSWAVNRALDRVRPDLVVLGESELWPNFLRIAESRGVPVAVINARMSPRSAGRFERFGFLTRGLFSRVRLFATQTDEYGERYRRLGAPRVVVTGSIKYDGAQVDRENPRTVAVRDLFQTTGQLVFAAGSTQAPEEDVCLKIFQKARQSHPDLRLLLVPRQKERFGEVAKLLEASGVSFARRSELTGPTSAPVVLVDTIGELGAIWGLADVAFVGGSLDGQRGGQNMIEPAAYGAAVVFGPHTWNFKETVARLRAHDAAVQVGDAAALDATVTHLLAHPEERQRLGTAAKAFVRSQQGATERTLDAIDELLASNKVHDQAA